MPILPLIQGIDEFPAIQALYRQEMQNTVNSGCRDCRVEHVVEKYREIVKKARAAQRPPGKTFYPDIGYLQTRVARR